MGKKIIASIALTAVLTMSGCSEMLDAFMSGYEEGKSKANAGPSNGNADTNSNSNSDNGGYKNDEPFNSSLNDDFAYYKPLNEAYKNDPHIKNMDCDKFCFVSDDDKIFFVQTFRGGVKLIRYDLSTKELTELYSGVAYIYHCNGIFYLFSRSGIDKMDLNGNITASYKGDENLYFLITILKNGSLLIGHQTSGNGYFEDSGEVILFSSDLDYISTIPYYVQFEKPAEHGLTDKYIDILSSFF